ncbi:MAG TPA: hypothetical protein P5567_01100 [Kiritimatiellia bacterium]|nr:hypothetical protein [Kiritimatiellia bacterium]HRZ11031.1 hypothetical protein [Kiritimatiellia bacterium]HSA18604.1 hypothetical protein [Kiritimatiellia bacterium]
MKASVVACIVLAGMAVCAHAGRVFFQDFTNSTDWTSYRGANSNCFNAFIASSGGSASNQFRVAEESLEAARTNYVSWALCRLTDLGVNSYAQYEIELNITTVEQASAGAMNFYFGDGLHSNANAEVTTVLAMKFTVETLPGNRFRAYHANFSSPTNSGPVKFTIIVNSGESPREYTDPLGRTQVVEGGNVDAWCGEQQWIDGLHKIKAGVIPREFKIHSQSGFAVTRFDSFAVYNRPPGEESVYVWAASPQEGPGEEWSNAFHDIQSAIDAAPTGAVIVVTNGVYAAGGCPAPGSGLTNRICITNAITVRSVNGPSSTFIVGSGPFGPAAARGAYVGAGAALIGFTVQGGHTLTNGDELRDQSGGGVFCERGACVQECVLAENLAWRDAGGVRGGALDGCELTGNTACRLGGGALGASLDNCLLQYNEAGDWSGGGGAAESVLSNCVVRHNISAAGKAGGAWRCALAGCVVSGNTAAAYGGGASESTLRDCRVVQNQANEQGGGAAASELLSCVVSGNWASVGGGAWECSLTNSTVSDNEAEFGGGAADCIGLDSCVLSGNRAAYGGGAWGCVLTNCELAANTAMDGVGGGVATSLLFDCVLRGNFAAGNSVGGGAFESALHGCRLDSNRSDGAGGGAYNSLLAACVLCSNMAVYGGGAATGALAGCTIVGNQATQGGGAWRADLAGCLVESNSAVDGGGAYEGRLVGCRMEHNEAANGGAVCGGVLFNCLLVNNRAAESGGGGCHSELHNCTVVGNESAIGAGLCNGAAVNTILYANVCPEGQDHTNSALSHCRAPPPADGPGNMTNDPCFLSAATGDFRLASSSCCIGTGVEEDWMTGPGCRDLAGLPRVVGDTADLGAYEYPYTSSGIYAPWLEQFGLPLDGSIDHQDPDGDGYSTWQEWRAGTIPTNARSLFRLCWDDSGPPSGRVLRWPGAAGRRYAVDRTQDLLSPGLDRIASGLEGRDGFMTYTDATATADRPAFYRVLIEDEGGP